MISFERAISISSGLDVIVLELEGQEIVQNEDIENYIPGSALVKKAEEYISVGPSWEKNPTCWAASDGNSVKELPDWSYRLARVLSNSPNLRVKWADLDNNSKVVTVTSEVSVLAINCRDLSLKLVKEAKCAKIFTAFGQIDLAL